MRLAVAVVLAGAIVASSGVVFAKGHLPDVQETRLTAATTVDGVDLPAGTRVTRQAVWDDARDGYGAYVLAAFQLKRASDVCSRQIPGGVEVSVRQGLPAFVDIDPPPTSTATHLVWTTRRATRIGGRRLRAGDTVGVECPTGRLTLLSTARGFHVGALKVSAALWYPTDLGGGLAQVDLRAPAEISKIRVPAGFRVTFAADGTLRTVLGPSNLGVAIGDRVCQAGSVADEIHVAADGQVKCTEVDTHGVHCDPDAEIRLDDDGQLAHCMLAASR